MGLPQCRRLATKFRLKLRQPISRMKQFIFIIEFGLFFLIINMGVRANFHATRLIPRVLKLIIM
jgi:hypothetical protein